jgi:hypothetical protein
MTVPAPPHGVVSRAAPPKGGDFVKSGAEYGFSRAPGI